MTDSTHIKDVLRDLDKHAAEIADQQQGVVGEDIQPTQTLPGAAAAVIRALEAEKAELEKTAASLTRQVDLWIGRESAAVQANIEHSSDASGWRIACHAAEARVAVLQEAFREFIYQVTCGAVPRNIAGKEARQVLIGYDKIEAARKALASTTPASRHD